MEHAFDDELHPYEQFRYEHLIAAFCVYLPPSVRKRSIQELDELITSILEDNRFYEPNDYDGQDIGSATVDEMRLQNEDY